MSPQLIFLLLFTGTVALVAAKSPPPHQGLVHAQRSASSDLEITGMVSGLAPGQVGYVRYEDLLKLPQTNAVVTDNPDYPTPPLHVTGIPLDVLSAAIGALPGSDLIDAPCADRYRSHFPAEYIAQHRPLLVLKIDGKPLNVWAKQARQYDPSPYVVMYQHFTPSFKVLTHSDQAQLPDNLLRLDFTTQAATFGPLAPRGTFPAGSPEQNGFTIARQNCLRCHFMGTSGGTKSGRSWTSLGNWAAEQPNYFKAYIKNPQKLEPHAHMEGSPRYDEATLEALVAYFRTFSDARSKGESR